MPGLPVTVVPSSTYCQTRQGPFSDPGVGVSLQWPRDDHFPSGATGVLSRLQASPGCQVHSCHHRVVHKVMVVAVVGSP